MSNPVLYVDDDATDILLCQHALAKCRCTLNYCYLQKSLIAVDWLLGRGIYHDRQSYPLPAVLVTDLKMPLLDGFDLIQLVRSNVATHELPIIVLSSSPLERDKRRALALGATIFLTKTTDYFQLIQTVRPFACKVHEQFCTKRRAPEICQ